MQAPCQTADATQSRRSRIEDLPFLDLFGEPPNVAFEAPVALTSNRERTPQGWLKIKDVVIARLGVQDYHASELPLEPGPTGYIVIERLEEDLFAPEAIASFEGVPIVDEHPRDAAGMPHMLDSATTIPVLRGVLTNVRRGTGDQARYMMGDAILYCDKTIGLVEAGKRQVSAGYTADYMRLEAGRGRQINFRGNHLAIVHRGRCGEECAFGDEEPQHMTTAHQPAEPARSAVPRLRGRTSLRDVKLARILHAFRTGDEDLAAAELDAALPEENTVADPLEDIRAAIAQLKDGLAALQARMDAANEAPAAAAAAEVAEAVQEVAEAAAEMAGDESLPDEMTTDAAFRDTISRGEVLAPGLGVPTGDAVATPAARGKTIIALQRRALDKAWDAHQGIRPIFGTAAKPTFDAMPAAALRGYFIAASEQVRAANRQPVLPAGLMPTIDGSTHRPPSVAERQKAFDDFWGRKRA